PADAPPSPNLVNVYVVDVSQPIDPTEVCRKYRGDPPVEWCQPDYRAAITAIPNDPYYSSAGSWGQSYPDLWGAQALDSSRAWDTTQGDGIVVAVVDTGLDMAHPDIATNVWTNAGEIPNNGYDDDGNLESDDIHGWDFVANNNNPDDRNGHGTHVAGTIAAVGNNGLGVVGVAPRAKIMAGFGGGGTGAPAPPRA